MRLGTDQRLQRVLGEKNCTDPGRFGAEVLCEVVVLRVFYHTGHLHLRAGEPPGEDLPRRGRQVLQAAAHQGQSGQDQGSGGVRAVRARSQGVLPEEVFLKLQEEEAGGKRLQQRELHLQQKK